MEELRCAATYFEIMNMKADVLIAGGGTGGCAAAWAACRTGLKVVLTEEYDWIGGQFTSQGVPPDEHGWIEQFGCTASYRRLRNEIRGYYRGNYPLTPEACAQEFLNPGGGWVSPLCHEPKVAHAVIESILRPFIEEGKLTVLKRARCVAANYDHDRILAVTFERGDAQISVEADWFIDATELGDLLPITGTEFVTGSEAGSVTGEPGAPGEARPENSQAFSWCFAMEHFEGEDFTIPRPKLYSYWVNYVPPLNPPWTGRLFSLTACNPRTLEPISYRFEPNRESSEAFSGMWTYRRILDRSLFAPGAFGSDICLVNWPMIDFLDGDLCTAEYVERQEFLMEAREMALCFFYWLQTEAPREDGGTGWPGLRLCGAPLGTEDGFSMAPYIRESRRIQAVKTVTEQEVSAAYREKAEYYPDSVGIGSYRIDLHMTVGGDNYVDVPALPFQIPLGALIPVRMRNLLPACKNIGTTHITNGCYRLHPVEWNIGEAAGLLASFCHWRRTEPHSVAENFVDFQDMLVDEGVELEWPRSLDLGGGDAHSHARKRE